MRETERSRLTDVGAAIRRAREAHGIRLTDLALLSGISGPALSSIETGKRDLRVSSLLRIAAALRVEPGELLGPPTGDAARDRDVGRGR